MNDAGGHRPEISNGVADHRRAYTERHHRVLLLKEITFKDTDGNLVKVKTLIGRMVGRG